MLAYGRTRTSKGAADRERGSGEGEIDNQAQGWCCVFRVCVPSSWRLSPDVLLVFCLVRVRLVDMKAGEKQSETRYERRERMDTNFHRPTRQT